MDSGLRRNDGVWNSPLRIEGVRKDRRVMIAPPRNQIAQCLRHVLPIPSSRRRPGPILISAPRAKWIPAFAGMTECAQRPYGSKPFVKIAS
jgi:hypothetical protein